MAKTTRVIIQCGKSETFEILPSEKISDTDAYFMNEGVSERLDHSIAQAEKGKVTPVSSASARERLEKR